MLGYSGKFIQVNLTDEEIREITFDEDILRQYLGGRGLAAKILWDELGETWETTDPLEPENILLFLTGPLTGFFPGARICVSGKSPQSNGVVGSTVGGEFGVELRCAGYDGIIVYGKARNPRYLFVKDSIIQLNDASHLWGMDAKQTLKALTQECRAELHREFPRYGEFKEPAVLYIGPAGENQVRTAVVGAKWAHAAGYGGYGAVMGSKNLKAIAAKGTGPLPQVADIRKVKRLIQKLCTDTYEDVLWRRWGTGAAGYEVGARISAEPVRNWQDEWHDEKSYGVDQFENRVWIKQFWSDFGCPICCLKVAMTKAGPLKGAITDDPDYELQAYLGPNLGLFTPEENVYLASLVDDLGLCGIQTGNVLGFTAELYQRGILTAEDIDGIVLKWGDVEAFASLARKIASRDGVGNLLAEGTYRAAQKLSEMKKRDVLPYAVQSKGIGIGAHGIRSGKDYPHILSYACSVQGGDHTSIASLPFHGSVSEVWRIFNDSAVFCNFNSFGVSRKDILDFYEAVIGESLTQEEWCDHRGLRILQLQRSMLLLGGPDLKWDPEFHDDNPPRFYDPLPSGPYKGRTVEKANVRKAKRRYYEVVGWDSRGIPTSDSLRHLGLKEVDAALEKLRVK
ncbi:MAG: aldehyde ferredoxin oxidoreductase [Candidatus Bathyarchaeota archaeon]|nr:MAG: aldehyde ferredoxin oxidoreductase [Candidatus Bathyarchaeota archaeon]